VVIVSKGAREFEPDGFVVRGDDHQFIFSGVILKLRMPKEKGRRNNQTERKENRNDATHRWSPGFLTADYADYTDYFAGRLI
jgi:hypothetical protein